MDPDPPDGGERPGLAISLAMGVGAAIGGTVAVLAAWAAQKGLADAAAVGTALGAAGGLAFAGIRHPRASYLHVGLGGCLIVIAVLVAVIARLAAAGDDFEDTTASTTQEPPNSTIMEEFSQPSETRPSSLSSIASSATTPSISTTSTTSPPTTTPSTSTSTSTTAAPTTVAPQTVPTTSATTTAAPQPVALLSSSANYKHYEPEEVLLQGADFHNGLRTYLVSCSGDDGDVWEFDLGGEYAFLSLTAGVSRRTNVDASLRFVVTADGNRTLVDEVIPFGPARTYTNLPVDGVYRLTLQILNTRNRCGTISGEDDVAGFGDPMIQRVSD